MNKIHIFVAKSPSTMPHNNSAFLLLIFLGFPIISRSICFFLYTVLLFLTMVAFQDKSIWIFTASLLLFFVMMAMTTPPDCPLNLSQLNFTVAATMCANKEDRAECCRYINALVAISVSRYANVTTNLGVTPDLSDVCLNAIAETLALSGITRNATIFCGFGTKILVNYECQGRTTVTQMEQSPKFSAVSDNCKVPLVEASKCKKCVYVSIAYLHNLVTADNVTFSTCRDATFAALASQVNNGSAVHIAECFFGVQELNFADLGPSPSLLPLESPLRPPFASSSSDQDFGTLQKENHHSYHLTVVSKIGIAVTVLSITVLVVIAILFHRKIRELEDTDSVNNVTTKGFHQASRKFQRGISPMFRKFNYKEINKATNNFTTAIGQGGFGTVYKAEFHDGVVLSVKRMDRVSVQAETEFCREIELLARLHHRHLVSLRGFCIDKRERFLMYDYMPNGSLKDHLDNVTHSATAPGRAPLCWSKRLQIAIDVANSLEYLHFYCDPPLCHRDIKSSNILLDENFSAKVADFGLVHASKDGSICFEPVNTDIRGTPGYMDPEYVVTHELTEKSDVYSYGIVLLELLTGRRAIQDNQNLVCWWQKCLNSGTMMGDLVDPRIGNSFDYDQVRTFVDIVKWCTQREGRARPSMKQVLRLLNECVNPMHDGFIQTIEDEEGEEWERSRQAKTHRVEGRYLASSSSSTWKVDCSRNFVLETGFPESPIRRV